MRGKVLFLTLTTFSTTGGIEKVNRAFGKALADFKVENEVPDYEVLSLYDDLPDNRYIPKANFKGFRGNRIQFITNAILLGVKSDVIVLSHIHLLAVAWLIKKVNRKARVYLFAHGIEVWKTLSNWKIDFLQKSAKVWAVSQFTKDKLSQNGINPEKIDVLNNCLDPFFEVNTKFEKPERLLNKYQLKSLQKVLFTLTRLSSAEQYKGYDEVLKAIPIVKDVYPDIHYILSGKADDAELDRVRGLIKSNGLENSVTITGFLSNEEVEDHYQLADVFIMPSKGEGFGITFIEAAANGCPVIAGNQDGSVDALLNGKLGLLVNPNDTSAIANSILSTLITSQNHPDKQSQQEKCIEAFSFSQYKRNIISLLS